MVLASISLRPGALAQAAADPVTPGASPQPAPSQPNPPGQPPPGTPAPLPGEEENAEPSADPNTPRRYSFEEASLSRVLRLLAKQAGIDYIEPPINPSEKISFELSNVTPLQAFEILAQRRGFRVVQNNGIYELVRDDLRNPNRDTIYATRTYAMRNLDVHLVVEGVANLLGMELKPPEGITKGYPKPQDIASASSFGSSGSSDTGTNESEGKFTSGFPMASAYAERQDETGEKEFIFTDRNNLLVVRTTVENHRELAAYLRRIDRIDDAIVVEVKVLSLQADKSKDIGAAWALFFGRDSAGNPLFSLDLGGATDGTPPNNAGGAAGVGGTGFPPNTTVFGQLAAGLVGGFTYSTFGYFLRDFQVAANIAFLKRNGRVYDISQPTVITKSGVPVTISSLTEEPVQNYTPSPTYTAVTGNNNNSAPAATTLATSIQTFKYGILLDVLATELRNGYVDLTITPRISSKIGSKDNGQGQQLPIIQANTTTTTVTVPPGRTVAMGGILALHETRDLRETPGLSKIPLIGKYLFSRNARALVRTNIIILVTPRLIKSGNGPVVTGGCDEQRALNLTRHLGSKIIGGRQKDGYMRTPNVDPADPCDPYEEECKEGVAPAQEGKGVVRRPATPYSK